MSTAFDPDGAAVPGSGIFGLDCSLEESRFALLPLPFEGTTSYRRGTAQGPAAILRESHQLDLGDRFFGAAYDEGIHLAAVPGELSGLAARPAEAGDYLAEVGFDWARRMLEAGRVAGIIGGEHSVPFGSLRAHAERWPGLGILQFDAHMDLRRAYQGLRWSHASIMFNTLAELPGVARLVQVGIRDFCRAELDFAAEQGERVRTFFDADLRARLFGGDRFEQLATEVLEALPEKVYVSFDIDGLEPGCCPHSGTPVPGGLSYDEAAYLLRRLAASGRQIVGFDLCEVAPAPAWERSDGDWDGYVGARVLYQLIGYAALSQR